MLAVTDVGKAYPTPRGPLAVLSNVTFSLSPGEAAAITGPSGSGKSSLLYMLGALEPPSTGEITLGGQNPFALPPRGLADFRNAQIGFVFQDPTLMPWADVADNVWLPLRLRGVSRRDARDRIAESLALVGLSDFAKAYPRELSGGMRMRVSIARALSLKPRLLLMDEPFAALDEMTRFKLNNDVLRL